MKPNTENDLVEACADLALKGCTKIPFETLLKARKTVETDELSDLTAMNFADAGYLDEEFEDDDVALELAKAQANSLKKQLEIQKINEAAKVRPQSSKSKSASHRDPAPAPAISADMFTRKVDWNPLRGLTQPEGKNYKPPSSSLHKDVLWHHRWHLKAKWLDTSVSKAYGKDAPKEVDDEAFAYVMSCGWDEYVRKHGGECPYDFGIVALFAGLPS